MNTEKRIEEFNVIQKSTEEMLENLKNSVDSEEALRESITSKLKSISASTKNLRDICKEPLFFTEEDIEKIVKANNSLLLLAFLGVVDKMLLFVNELSKENN